MLDAICAVAVLFLGTVQVRVDKREQAKFRIGTCLAPVGYTLGTVSTKAGYRSRSQWQQARYKLTDGKQGIGQIQAELRFG